MKHKTFVVALLVVIFVASGCQITIGAPYPTQTPYPTYTSQSTATPLPTDTPFPTLAPTASQALSVIDCVSTEAYDYIVTWKALDNRFSDVYDAFPDHAKNGDVAAVASDLETMLKIIQETKALQPPLLYQKQYQIFLAEENAFANAMSYLLIGKNDEAKAQFKLQTELNGEGQAEMLQIATFCGYPVPTNTSGING